VPRYSKELTGTGAQHLVETSSRYPTYAILLVEIQVVSPQNACTKTASLQFRERKAEELPHT
jgi:hypothetical protein